MKKTFILKDGENPVKSDGTIIEWKEGKDVTKKVVKKVKESDNKIVLRNKKIKKVVCSEWYKQ